jgi:hypothetical protein
MAASDHLSDRQLSMLMPAGRIMDEFYPGDASLQLDKKTGEYTQPPPARGWKKIAKKKGAEADAQDSSGRLLVRMPEGTPSLREDIAAHGIKTPITVDYRQEPPVVWNGHHRVVVANDLDPTTEIPIESVP